MRIGEILVGQRKLRQGDLDRALREKPEDKRLLSYLIAKGLVDFDDASRALGDQKGIACALSKHLAGRDATLAELIPAALGRATCALPIGRTSRGAVIVCVRDPAPAVLEALRQAVDGEIMMVIAPASRLESLVDAAYGAAPVEEVDVDFSAPIEVPLDPTQGDLAALDADSVRLALTDLDDVRVDKDFTQSGTHTVPPLSSPSIRMRATKPMSLASTNVGLEHASSREAATDLVLAFVGTRWRSGLVLAIRDRSALGYRGHGVTMPDLVSIPLQLPSVLQRAVETRAVSTEVIQSPAQEVLMRALGGPSIPIAAPVIVGGTPVAAIVVGDALDGQSAIRAAATELGMLAEALGKAYQRVALR